MTATKRAIESRHGDLELESFLLTDPEAGPRPVVMIFPNFIGLDEVDDENAERILGLGYAAFGCDLYGKGQRGGGREEGLARMQPLRADRPLLQARMLHLLDLARTGADIAGVASFHGLFTPPGNIAEPRITARVAVYHGWEDAIVPPEDVIALGRELTGAGCDWQIHCFGGAVHGFTHARPPEEGIPYNALADRRSWHSAEAFLAECFA